MIVDTTPWDAADTLHSADDIAHYIDAVLEDAMQRGDFTMLPHALGAVARARGMTDIARETGLSRESLYKALSEDGNPSFATVLKVLRALDIRLRASVRTGTEAA